MHQHQYAVRATAALALAGLALAPQASALQGTQTRLVDLALNGDLDHVSPDGTHANESLGAGSVDLVHGGFWVGAEDHVHPQGSSADANPQSVDRHVRLTAAADADAFVFQRAGADRAYTDGVTARVWVRIPNSSKHTEARLTVSEAPVFHESLRDKFDNCIPQYCPTFTPHTPSGAENCMGIGAVPDNWEFFLNTGGPDVAMLECRTGGGKGRVLEYDPDLCGPCAIDVMENSVSHYVNRWFYLRENGGTFVVEWIAPQDGLVRSAARAYRPAGSDGDHPVHHLVSHVSDAASTPLLDRVLPGSSAGVSDLPGAELVVRRAVTAGDRIRFEFTSLGPSAEAVKVFWNPVMMYEGDRITYRIHRADSQSAHASFQPDANEVFVDLPDIPLPGNSWTSTGIQTFGADFEAVFQRAPTPPLDLMLWVPEETPGAAYFDDVAWQVPFEERTMAELRDDVLAEAEWARGNYRLALDSGASQVGPEASPYVAQSLGILTGPATQLTSKDCDPSDPQYVGTTANGCYGSSHADLYETLLRRFEKQAFEDFNWIEEQTTRRRDPITGLPSQAYNNWTDQFECRPTDAVVNLSDTSRLVSRYYRTGDPGFLDRAYDAAQVASDEGVFPPSVGYSCSGSSLAVWDHEQMIAHKRYQVYDVIGVPMNALDPCELDFHERLRMPVAMIRAYVACRLFDEGSGVAPRYAGVPGVSGISSWLPAIRDAVVRIRDVHQASECPVGDCDGDCLSSTWGGTGFHSLEGLLNDNYGYHSREALVAWSELAPQSWLGDTGDPDHDNLTAIRDALQADLSVDPDPVDPCDVLVSGAQHLIGRWEQAVSRNDWQAGDEARGYDAMAHLVDAGLEPGPEVSKEPIVGRIQEQLVRAALHSLRFQFSDPDDPGVQGIWTSGEHGEQQLEQGAPLLPDPKVPSMPIVHLAKLPPGEYVDALAIALRVLHPVLDAGTIDDLVAIASSQFRVTKAHYRRTFGYAGAVDDPPGTDRLAGAERRILLSMMGVVDELDAIRVATGDLAPPPVAGVSPTSFQTGPAVGSRETFVFSIEMPGASDAELLDAFNQRTCIYRWSFGAPPADPCTAADLDPGRYTRLELWPTDQDPNDYLAIDQDSIVTDNGVLTVELPFGGVLGQGDFEYVIVTHDADGRWTSAVSAQEGW